MLFHANASKGAGNACSGSSASGCPTASEAVRNARGIPRRVSPLIPSAPISAMSFALASQFATPNRPHHVVLIAIIDTDVGINRPNEHRINSAVTSLQVVQIFVDGITPCLRVVEVAVLAHD